MPPASRASSSPSLAPRGSRLRALVARFAAVMLGLAALHPAMASAETLAPLPKGYTSDELPAQADAADDAAQPVSDSYDDSGEYLDTDPSALTDFRAPLDAYGSWVVDPRYGTIWVPSTTVVGADFAPYQTAGHWSLDENDEWIWVSDYDWGYIPFHYGRWLWISGTGWGWIPGRVYAPAWVVWRIGDGGYVGWAPTPPTYYWSGGVALGLWLIPPAAYVFCPTTYLFHDHVHTYVVRDHHTVRHAAQHTHAYKPAQPTGGHTAGGQFGSHTGATPGASSGHIYRSASPSLLEAKIPASAAPKARVKGDPRAAQLARPGKAQRSSVPALSPRSRAARASRDGNVPSTRNNFEALPSRRGPSAGAPSTRGPSSVAPPTRGPSTVAPPARGRQQPVLRTPSPRAPRFTPSPRSTPRVTVPAPRASVPAPRSPVPAPRATVPVRKPSVSVPSPAKPAPAPVRAPAKVAPKAHRR